MKNITIKNAAFCLILLLLAGAIIGGQQVQADNTYLFSEAAGEEEEVKEKNKEDCITCPDEASMNNHTFRRPEILIERGSGEGDFRVIDYATGFENNNWHWRGYVFKPSRDVTVLGLWGGSGSSCSDGFGAAIFEVTITGSGTSPAFNIADGAMLQSVDFTDFTDLTPEYVAFDEGEELVLKNDKFYLIAQGRTGDSGSNCHYASTFIDYENLEIGSPIIDTWYPQQNDAYNLQDGGKPPVDFEDKTYSAITDVRTLVGFRYETDVGTASLTKAETRAFQLDGTDNVVMEGLLKNSGGTQPDHELTLYFEYATKDDFSENNKLVSAEPFKVTGVQTNVPFSRTVTNTTAGTTYYYRAVAINEAGRTNGETESFTVGSMNTGYLVNATITHGASNGSVTPAARAVPHGETTTFLITPNEGFFIQSVTGCGGTLSGQTYTTGAITEACGVEIRLVPALIYRSVKSGDWNDLSTWEQAIVNPPTEEAHWAPATSYPGEIANADGIGDPMVEVRSDDVVNIDGYAIVFDAVEITGDGKIIVKQSNNGKLTIGNKLNMAESTTINIE